MKLYMAHILNSGEPLKLKPVSGISTVREKICAVYFHVIQPSVSESDWEIAETTMRFPQNGFNPERILSHDLLLDCVSTAIHSDTHWNQDLNSLN